MVNTFSAQYCGRRILSLTSNVFYKKRTLLIVLLGILDYVVINRIMNKLVKQLLLTFHCPI